MALSWFHDALLADPESPALAPGSLLVEDGFVRGVFGPDLPPPEDAFAIALGGRTLAPGFLDLHYHGRLIFCAPAVAPAELSAASRRLVAHGVTGFLPTTVAWPSDRLMTQVSAWAAACDAGHGAAGAAILGVHLEGPWIRPEAAGAQPRAGIRPYDADEGRELFDRAEGRVRMVTFAPEADGAAGLLAELVRRGIVPSLGHSHAPAEDAQAAIDAGARHVTHLFNAMGGLHHRTLGLAGVALTDDRLTCDLICDGVHVDPAVMRLAARAKANRLCLITDNVEPGDPGDDAPDDAAGAPADTGLGAGDVRDDGTVLRLADGTLAGSNLTLDRAVRNAIAFGAMSGLEAIRAVTLRPAEVLGLASEVGTFRPGARADLVVLDGEGRVDETRIAGEVAYRASADRASGHGTSG